MEILKKIDDLLIGWGISPSRADMFDQFIAFALILAVAFLADALCRKILLKVVAQLVKKTKATWDDIVFDRKVMVHLSRMVAPVIIYLFVPLAFVEVGSSAMDFIRRICLIYIIITFLSFVNSFLKAVYSVYSEREQFRDRPLKGMLQTMQVILWLVGGIVVVGELIGRDPLSLLAGLGASAAILMLVFKDSIMGFVSGVQLSANDMLKVGDWIAMPKYGADGTVIEVTLNTVMAENAAIRWKDGDDYDNNPWYREYKERFNIQVKNDWVSNDYKTKLNLSIAEGNLPDVFTVDSQQLKELQEADLIWDLSEIWEENASDLLKSYMEENKATFETAKIDGKLYGVPQLSLGPVDQIPVMWVKKDWKAESGVEEIKTIADFEKMAKAIKEKHGDFAITETSDLAGMFAMAPGWGAYPNIWVEKEDGSIEYGSTQQEMKQVLETYARWYKEGLLDPEFTITDGDKMFQKVLNEEAGISPFSTWFVWGVGPGSIEQFGVDGTFDAYPMPTVNGEDAKGVIEFANYGYNVISKDCLNPGSGYQTYELLCIYGERGRK